MTADACNPTPMTRVLSTVLHSKMVDRVVEQEYQQILGVVAFEISDKT